jgi:O-antigen ligase
MDNQDLAQSDTEVASTPSTGALTEEKTLDLVDVAQTSAAGAHDASVEVVNMPKTPADAAPAESRDVPQTPIDAAPPLFTFKLLRGLSPFWHDCLIETGLILSMGLYYLVGNVNFGAGNFLHLAPYLYSFPFLAIFAFLSWYRLPFALALMPLALPYYGDHMQKTIFSQGSRQFNFSLAEITLVVCALIALGQLLLHGKQWRYRLSWRQVRDRVGPFIAPIAIFVLAALVSIVVAVSRLTALRAFHEEILAPLLYLLLALCCLRTSRDVKRLVWAFLGSALIIAIAGLIQYFFFPDLHQQALGGDRAHAMYGSANSIGLFFDYALPFGMALLIFQVNKALHSNGNWWNALLVLAVFVPLVGVLAFSQSLGTALALPIALLFILAMSVRRRKTLLIGTCVLLVLAIAGGIILRHPLTRFITTWHVSSQGISTITKRLYLWQSAWHMIQRYPLFGVGLDNWLCHFSVNTSCQLSTTMQQSLQHFVITTTPANQPTGLQYELDLSHPHDIFLQVWVSIGIFGLLAFVAILALFAWLFVRVVKTVRQSTSVEITSLEWLVLGVGGAMLAALCQGLVDSSFLEQDLAFCFWMLVAALLVLRVLTGTSWRRKTAS